ncbi:MAG: transcription-repair coupling factor [Betaproteobacteria bacterium]|jgi:transcription-repair coupling factor (superfamily II helicase)|nr:transcription-repair coupling factor [Betaproteobacteria bacterium]
MLPVQLPAPGQRASTALLQGSSDALALAALAARARPLLVLTESAWQAQRLLQEIPFFAPQLRVHLLPDWETLPYDHFSPHHDLVSERLATLCQIARGEFDIALVPVTTALYRMAPVDYITANTFYFRKGEKLGADALRHQLTLAGYNHVTQVIAPGEYSFRGGLIDLYPMGSPLPYRIDLFDEVIDSIRSFDVDSQRSIMKVPEVRLLPAREFPLDKDAQTHFRQRFRERFEGDPSRSQVYKDVSKGIPTAGVEYFLPLFFDQTALITDYLPPETTVCLRTGVTEAIDEFWADTRGRHAMVRGDLANPVLPPQELFLTEDAFFGAIKPFARVELAAAKAVVAGSPEALDENSNKNNNLQDTLATAPLPPLHVERRADDPLHRLRRFLTDYEGRVLVLAETLGRRETMLEYFAEYDLKTEQVADWTQFLAGSERFMLTVAPLHTGFIDHAHQVAVVTENELYAAQVRQRAVRDAKRTSPEGMLRDLSEVKIGDPVVHETHGIGRYLGLQTLDQGEGSTEFLTLEYAKADKLYVPVSSLHLISRYSGAAPEQAPLHQLGSGQWDKAKKKAAAQVHDTAAELLALYAQRATREGYAFKLTPHDYEAFAEGFPFEETADQAAAITATLDDLKSTKPMDRLICGDVGFGKTEVALRAAFVAVADGKQVAVLVPTTLLAEQHFNTFSDRFADWPVKVAELSRFRSAKETTEALHGLAEGRVDIAIGTHKLIGRDVNFKNLGLVILDEEHRFGVRQKERLKALRAEVDVLTLTATPIPRTLALSLEGLRDFSVIATAPQRRLAIKTFVARYAKSLIREAVLRELKRGGQIYFLHNDIDTIRNVEEELTRLLPEARIRIAHGQMRERELELAMRDFYQGRFNVLLCTTIIETGIDIPTANTIIINRADRFGLAQLHQLRGRVGRSHHQAYAYMLLPDEGNITSNAKKRLEAIQSMEELGSGFFLAMHDLEIRGAGEVLGESQSGEIHEIGFNLYCAMLDSAVKSLKAGKVPDLNAPLGVTTEINLHAPALLPADYCSDVHERLVLYKRLANCEDDEQLQLLQEELVDRFGALPDPTRTLIDSHRLRLLGKPLGIARIDASDSVIQLQFVPNPPIEPMKIITLIQTRKNYKLAGQDRLRIEVKTPDLKARTIEIRRVFAELS